MAQSCGVVVPQAVVGRPAGGRNRAPPGNGHEREHRSRHAARRGSLCRHSQLRRNRQDARSLSRDGRLARFGCAVAGRSLRRARLSPNSGIRARRGRHARPRDRRKHRHLQPAQRSRAARSPCPRSRHSGACLDGHTPGGAVVPDVFDVPRVVGATAGVHLGHRYVGQYRRGGERRRNCNERTSVGGNGQRLRGIGRAARGRAASRCRRHVSRSAGRRSGGRARVRILATALRRR